MNSGIPRRLRPEVIDGIYGTIYGQCAGDAIGLLTEFMSKEEAKKYYGKHKHLEFEHKVPDMHRQRWKNGDWTDDSDQMILIMLSITANDGKVVPTDIAVRLKNWMLHGFAELGDLGGMGIGMTTKAVLTNPCFTEDPHRASTEVWEASQRKIAANGGAMRTSVVGIHHFTELSEVGQNAEAICRVTHADPRCVASCVAVCLAIAYILRHRMGYPLDTEHPQRGLDVDLITRLCRDASVVYLPSEQVAEFDKYIKSSSLSGLSLAEPGSIGYTLKAMGSGFWAMRQHRRSFRSVIQELVMEGGDADSNASVAGAMLGAVHGYSKLPESWRNKLHYAEWLNDHINSFLRVSFGSEEQGAE